METERLILRSFTEMAFHEVKKMTEKDALEYFGHDSYEKVKNTLERLNYRMFECNDGFRRWDIMEKSSGKVIGDVGLHAWVKMHDRAEIGYILHPAARGKGYITEAARLVVKHGFEVLALNRIEAYTGSDNMASQNVLKKLGFSHEGMKKGHFKTKSGYVDSEVFGLTAWDMKKIIS